MVLVGYSDISYLFVPRCLTEFLGILYTLGPSPDQDKYKDISFVKVTLVV